MLWVGENGSMIIQTWNLNDKDNKTLQSYYDGFEQYIKPRSKIIYNRHKVQCRMQNQDEAFEQFVTE